MTAPTPDEAAACDCVTDTELNLTENARTVQRVIDQTPEAHYAWNRVLVALDHRAHELSALRADLAQARAIADAVQELTAKLMLDGWPLLPWPELPQDVAFVAAQLDAFRAREQAVRPVLDAAEAWVDWRERTGQPEGLEHYLWAIRDAVAAYRAAASGSAEAPMSVNEHGAGEHVNDHADHGNAHGSAEADEPAPAWVRDETRTEWAVRTTGTGGVEMIGGVTTELHARAWAQQAVGDHPGEIAAAVPVSRTIVHRVSAWTSDAERAAAVPAVASGDDTQPDGRGVAAQAVLSRWAVLSDDDAHSTMSLADAYKIVDVVSRALAEAGAPAQPDERPAMKPANYWRATFGPHACDPTNRSAVWCESSDEAEVRASLRNAPGGGLVFRLFERPRETDWRPAPLAGAADTAREPTDA